MTEQQPAQQEPTLFSPVLTSSRTDQRGPLAKWLLAGRPLDSPTEPGEREHPWYLVLWLTGVDYFSTLGYQPGIALLAAGAGLPIATLYLLLNVVVLGRCMWEILQHPQVLPHWRQALATRGDWTGVLIGAAIIFPRLALGLSGFETGVSVMPLIKGDPEDESRPTPTGRIRNTRRLLTSAALIMSVLLLVSSFTTTLLIPPDAYKIGGEASGRPLAYLAHLYLGNIFGSLYDFSTILILWFAGASAMAGLLHLIPRYLPRLGMAPSWAAYPRPLVLVLFGANLLVTFAFRANVEAQGGA